MKPAVILFILCNWFFASLSLSAHSMELSHHHHGGEHIHFEHTIDPDSGDAEDGDNSHIHLPLELLIHRLTFNKPLSSGWTVFDSQSWLSQSDQPPIPPPTR